MPALDHVNKDGTIYEIVPEIAPLFNTSTAYAVGDCVIKDAVLYRFKTAHSAGAWNSSEVDAINLGEEVTALKQDFNQLNHAIDYASVSFVSDGLGYIDSTGGSVGTHSTAAYTDYVNISNYKTIKYRRTKHTGANPSAGMAFYNASKTYISGVAGVGSQASIGYVDELYEVAVPDNAVYARFTYWYDTTTYGDFEIDGMTYIGYTVNTLDGNLNKYNPNMGAGYASQLVSSLCKSDSVPYNFRKVPYDSTLEDGGIVGASVAWNQIIDASKWPATKTSNGITFTNDGNGKITANGTATETVTFVYADYARDITIPGHKYLIHSGLSSVGSASTFEFMVTNIGGTYSNLNLYTGDTIKTVNEVGYQIQFVVRSGATVSNLVCEPMFFDLTQTLGTTIADYVYGLETATAGSGVAWLKEHFPKQFDSGYQAYNAGEIKSISGLSEHKSVGFNQWDEEWEVGSIDLQTGQNTTSSAAIRSKNYIPVIPSLSYYVKKSGLNIGFRKYGANKEYLGFISANSSEAATDFGSDVHFIRFVTNSVTAYNPNNTPICVNISKTTGTPKNGDYVPYESHTYALDSTQTLRGILKLDSNNSLYADGDVYHSKGSVGRRFAEVAIGSLTWTLDGSSFKATGITDAKRMSGTTTPANAIMSNGSESVAKLEQETGVFTLNVGSYGNNVLYVRNSTYSDAATFKQAMTDQNVKLVYEIATPTTETASPYGNPQVINPDGTESYVYTDGAFELPVGHTSEYPVNVSGQLDDILDTPTTNGTYTLQATVADGKVSYEWVSAT